MPVLPFHHYIGPGNKIDNGPCVDADDCIAKKHDIKYENARTFDDIRIADIEAINEFRQSWIKGNWHSLIGDVGLSLKYGVETYTGVLYPKLDEYKCEIVHLFNDLLKLHCVNKTRLFHQYKKTRSEIDFYDFTKPYTSTADQNFFYVLVAWYQLCHKYHLQQNIPLLHLMNDIHRRNCKNPLHHLPPNKSTPSQNSHLLTNCDIFHIKTWVKFFELFQLKKMAELQDEYNDEEFSNIFIQYD